MIKKPQWLMGVSALIFAVSFAYYFVYYIPHQKQISDIQKYLQEANRECDEMLKNATDAYSKASTIGYKLDTYEGSDPQILQMKETWLNTKVTYSDLLNRREEWMNGCINNKLSSWGVNSLNH